MSYRTRCCSTTVSARSLVTSFSCVKEVCLYHVKCVKTLNAGIPWHKSLIAIHTAGVELMYEDGVAHFDVQPAMVMLQH